VDVEEDDLSPEVHRPVDGLAPVVNRLTDKAPRPEEARRQGQDDGIVIDDQDARTLESWLRKRTDVLDIGPARTPLER
jgi:hypothetical protein